MGLLDRLLGSKKKMNKYAMDSVDMVKVGLMYYLLPECEANYGKDYAAPLVAAVVNTVFSESPSNETGRSFIQNEDNLSKVRLVIEEIIKPEENLRQIITDAVRVKCTLSHAMSTNLSGPDFNRLCREPIDNLKRLSLLIPGGDLPDLSTFLQNASTFIQTCKSDLDYHRSE
ncbi:hypothetical protein ACFL36_05305 [Thermodesulfobacteriota bacterium]